MERLVIAESLVRNFEVVERGEGLVGAVSSVFFPKRKMVEALKGISFSLKKGELIGFIGPNGAGKTTTLKILSGVLHPSQGYVQVDGYVPWERRTGFLKEIALVMGQKNQLWWDLPARETFELNRAIYEIPRRRYQKTLRELVELLQVEELLSIPVRRLSLGQRMRMELVAALLHRPKVIFLDEPTIGLDVVAQQRMRDFIARYNNQEEATIILTSHNMDDVKSLAKRVIVIDLGRIVFDGGLTELVGKFSKEKVIRLYSEQRLERKRLEKVGRVVKMARPEVVLAVPRGVVKQAAAELLQSFAIDDLTVEEEPIDEVIRRVFGHSKDGKI